MKSSEQVALMRLFRGYYNNDVKEQVEVDTKSLKKLAKYGLIADNNCGLTEAVIDYAIKLYGIDGTKWNETFHKSFETVLETPIETLVVQQVVHYITTYGFEELGIFDEDTVYIPIEEQEVPILGTSMPLNVIHSMSKEMINKKLLELIQSDIALSAQTVEDVIELSEFIDRKVTNNFRGIKNNEVRSALLVKYDIMPLNNIDFLRWVLKKSIGTSTIIQNQETFDALHSCNHEIIASALREYCGDENGLEKLAEIFSRFKDLFLAFKVKRPTTKDGKYINKVINRIGHIHLQYHRPLPRNILDDLTIMPSPAVDIYDAKIEAELNKAPMYRAVRICNGVRYRLTVPKHIVYRIRNGKIYAKECRDASINALKKIDTIVYNNLVNRLKKNVEGKTVYIPINLTLTAPTSEKQFIGNMPIGSYIDIPRNDNMVFGIHWYNIEGANDESKRVDLDLSAIDSEGNTYGWRWDCRSDRKDIAFSGDMTTAPNPDGATEVFYISRACEPISLLVRVNRFHSNKPDIPFDFMIGYTEDNQVKEKYVIDPNNILAIIHNRFEKTVVNKSTEIAIGTVKVLPDRIRFYFDYCGIGDKIVSNKSEITDMVQEYIENSAGTKIQLANILTEAGAIVKSDSDTIETMEEVKVMQDDAEEILYRKVLKPVDINLSLEKIDKTTIINLFKED